LVAPVDRHGPEMRGRSKAEAVGADEGVRLDKWLWAARFFKTRELCAAAIAGGKVHYRGQRVKPAKLVELGAEIRVRQGAVERVVVVRALARQRRPAPEASLLYEETVESRRRREAEIEQMRLSRGERGATKGRPTKRLRRQMARLADRGRA
jgi:ribosome-associated heat shock protein Hsp15